MNAAQTKSLKRILTYIFENEEQYFLENYKGVGSDSGTFIDALRINEKFKLLPQPIGLYANLKEGGFEAYISLVESDDTYYDPGSGMHDDEVYFYCSDIDGLCGILDGKEDDQITSVEGFVYPDAAK